MDYNQNNNEFQGYQQPVEPQYTEPQYQQPVYQQPVEPQYNQAPVYNQPMSTQPEKEEGKGMAIASLVLGILSVTCCCGGWIPSILALVFGIISKSKKKENNGMAIAGIILGAIGIVLSIIVSILSVTSGGIETLVNDMYTFYY